jgi:hypothetical protein
MAITVRGRVVDGHLRVDTSIDLPDNTEVELTVMTNEEAEDEDERLLAAAIAEADAQFERGEGSSWEAVRERLHARSRDEAFSNNRPAQG